MPLIDGSLFPGNTDNDSTMPKIQDGCDAKNGIINNHTDAIIALETLVGGLAGSIDIYVNSAAFDCTTGLLTLSDTDAGTPDVAVDLSTLQGSVTDNSDGTYEFDDGCGNTETIDTNSLSGASINAAGILTLTQADGSTVMVDISGAGPRSSFMDNSDGTFTHNDGGGSAVTIDICDLLDDATCPLFNVNAGTTATTTDNANGDELIGYGDTIHFWSTTGGVFVTAGSARVQIETFQTGAGAPGGATPAQPGIYYDTATNTEYFHDGAGWQQVDGDNCIQCGTGAPTGTTPTQPNIYIDDSTGQTYYYDGTTWQAASVPSCTQCGTGAPTGATPTSPSIYIDDATGTTYVFDGTNWIEEGHPVQSGTGAPTGTTPITPGVYFDLTTGDEYYWDGTTWALANESCVQCGTGAPTGTTPTSPNIYFDDATGTQYHYDGTTWSTVGASFSCTDLNTCSINSLSDIDTATTAPASGQVLAWDGTNWVPTTAGGGGSFACTDLNSCPVGSLSNVDETTVAPTVGQALLWDGTNWVPDDAAAAPHGGWHTKIQRAVAGGSQYTHSWFGVPHESLEIGSQQYNMVTGWDPACPQDHNYIIVDNYTIGLPVGVHDISMRFAVVNNGATAKTWRAQATFHRPGVFWTTGYWTTLIAQPGLNHRPLDNSLSLEPGEAKVITALGQMVCCAPGTEFRYYSMSDPDLQIHGELSSLRLSQIK